jgi:radical SAM superfamily enzyme YgiQ (UPF0313 family)
MSPLREGEISLRKYPDPPRTAPLVLAAYPNSYRTGMSNLGLHFVYSTLAASGKFHVDRFFTDDAPSGRPAALFFTVSYEEDLLNIIRMLSSIGVEPLRENRDGGSLVVAGGPVVSSNPLPFFPIADILATGEGEEILPVIADTVAGCGDDRNALESRLSGMDGILMPGRIEKTRPAGPVDPEAFQRSAILTSDTVFPNMLLVEISRGCPGSCAFCMATSVYRPFRTVTMERFESILDTFSGGRDDIPLKAGLVSTAAAAHPQFTELLDAVMRRGGTVGLSSLRAADIDAAAAGAIGSAGIRSVSLAPESGAERVRFGIGKKVADETYLEAARLLSGAGISKITLYMLAGLPGEDEISAGDTKSFLRAFAGAAGQARVSVNLNVLVPKPRTPLQFHAMPGTKDTAVSIESMRSACRTAGLGFSVKGARSSASQAMIALGDERVGRAAVRAATGGTSWKRALRDEGFEPDSIYEERGLADELPWERVFGSEDREALLARYRAVKG